MGGELREEPAGVAKIGRQKSGTFEKVGVETGEVKGLTLEQLNLQDLSHKHPDPWIARSGVHLAAEGTSVSP